MTLLENLRENTYFEIIFVVIFLAILVAPVIEIEQTIFHVEFINVVQ